MSALPSTGAAALRVHEQLGDLAAAVVRLHLSEPRWAAFFHRRDHADVREFSHLAGLRVEGLGLGVLAEVLPMPYVAELEVVIVRHRASGWVRELARKNEDQVTEAEFDPETGIVTVYEGRKEFRELEKAARKAGYGKKRVPEYVPYRMLEVEAAANAVYAWAAEQILARRLPEERPSDPAEYATAARHEAQALRHRAHGRLMQAFLEPEIFEGAVSVTREPRSTSSRQLRVVENDTG